jgi:protocatechuate 3,4-dioxygenase beta subunit
LAVSCTLRQKDGKRTGHGPCLWKNGNGYQREHADSHAVHCEFTEVEGGSVVRWPLDRNLWHHSARAQYEDGSLIGSIHDATGAAVANAAVTVTNVNTGIVIKVIANGSGDYEVPSLRVGVYNIEAKRPDLRPPRPRTSPSPWADASAST